MSKSHPEGSVELAALVHKIRRCQICKNQSLKSPLPHDPRPVLRVSSTARICIAGQAPGTKVHEAGIPFQDPSGKRLRAWMGIERDIFYDQSKIAFMPMSFCFPGQNEKGGDLPPRKECAPAWRDELFEHMPNIELLILVGGYGQAWHLRKTRKKTLSETVENWREYIDREQGSERCGMSTLVTPHPSWRNNGWLKKNIWFEEELVPWLQNEVQKLVR